MSDNGNAKPYVPYEANHRLRNLLFVTTVVSQGQADFILQISKANEAAICLVCRGTGTYLQEETMTMPQKKDVVFSVIREALRRIQNGQRHRLRHPIGFRCGGIHLQDAHQHPTI